MTLDDVVENQDYVNAPYEMGLVTENGGAIPDPWPHRFKTPWPDQIKNSVQLYKWVLENSIPRYILKR